MRTRNKTFDQSLVVKSKEAGGEHTGRPVFMFKYA